MASYIVGGGFAALALQAFLPNATLISPRDPSTTLRALGFVQRRNFELNKWVAKKSYSLGAFSYQGSANLHDRLTVGGNSGVWGGFIDISKVSGVARMGLEKEGVRFSQLGSRLTGSSSPNENYRQMQDLNGNVLDASSYLRIGQDAYLKRITDAANLELIDCIRDVGSLESLELRPDDRVYLAMGVVQMLDLLVHSGRLADGDEIELDEHGMSFSTAMSPRRIGFSEREYYEIDYYPTGVIAHALGLQRHLKHLEALNFLGVIMKQRFYHATQSAIFAFKNGTFVDKSQNVGFGRSIHYCNLRINGIPLKEAISRFWPQCYVVGMAAIKQANPGPISNDILMCALGAVCDEQ